MDAKSYIFVIFSFRITEYLMGLITVIIQTEVVLTLLKYYRALYLLVSKLIFKTLQLFQACRKNDTINNDR